LKNLPKAFRLSLMVRISTWNHLSDHLQLRILNSKSSNYTTLIGLKTYIPQNPISHKNLLIATSSLTFTFTKRTSFWLKYVEHIHSANCCRPESLQLPNSLSGSGNGPNAQHSETSPRGRWPCILEGDGWSEISGKGWLTR
jgi:hypothetical protein